MSQSSLIADSNSWIPRETLKELTDQYLQGVGSSGASSDLRQSAEQVVKAYGEKGILSAIRDFNIMKSRSGEKLSFELNRG